MTPPTSDLCEIWGETTLRATGGRFFSGFEKLDNFFLDKIFNLCLDTDTNANTHYLTEKFNKIN